MLLEASRARARPEAGWRLIICTAWASALHLASIHVEVSRLAIACDGDLRNGSIFFADTFLNKCGKPSAQ